MEEGKVVVVRFGIRGYLISSPLVLFLAGLTVVFYFIGGTEFLFLLVATIIGTAFWLYYFLRLKAVYGDGALRVRRPFGKRLTLKGTEIAFVRRARSRINLYNKDGESLFTLYSYMNNADELMKLLEADAEARRDKRVTDTVAYLEPLNALLKAKCHAERFELTRSVKGALKKPAQKHDLETENTENSGTAAENATENSGTTAENVTENSGTAENAEGIAVLLLPHKTEAGKRILFYVKGRELHLKFLNTSVVISPDDEFDKAVAEIYEIAEDIITGKIVTVVLTDSKGRVVNSRAFYRKQTDRKAVKDAGLVKTGARVFAWQDKNARDFLNRIF